MTETHEHGQPGPNGPLYDLLLEKLPDYTRNYAGRDRLDIYKLAEQVGVSYQSIYQCLPSPRREARCKVSVKLAKKLIEISEKCAEEREDFEPLTLLDFGPFLPS